MMNRRLHYLCAAVALSAMTLCSCKTMGSLGSLAGSPDGSQGILESVLTSVLGGALPINEQSVIGTWTYSSPEVRFDSENALTQAGGMVAAQQIEAKLAEVYSDIGIKPGACSFVFSEGKRCSFNVAGQSIAGTFSIDPNSHAFSFRSSTGLISLNGKIYNTGNSLAVLFDAKKLLSIAQTLSMVTGQSNSTLGTLGQLLNKYDGLMLGMNLKK